MKRLSFVAAAVFLFALPFVSFAKEPVSYRLDNGLTVFLIENHGAPVISASLFVKVGASFETEKTNGISHLLEHMVFNGTTRRSQEEIYRRQAELGIFEHASTGKELTIFTFLSPRENAEPALELLSDILFNSIIPAEKLEKEKKIVEEEGRQARAFPGYLVADLLDQASFRGTPYIFPALGKENLVHELGRQEIVEFYQHYYRPDNMVALFIGDLKPKEFMKLVENHFGVARPASLPPEDRQALKPTIVQRRLVVEKADVPMSQVSLAFFGPGIIDADFIPFKAAVALLNGSGPAGLEARLKRLAPSSITQVSSDLELYQNFTRLVITAYFPPGVDYQEALAKLEQALKEFVSGQPDHQELEGAKNHFLTEQDRLEEQFHYFAYNNAPYFARGLAGVTRLTTFTDQLRNVQPSQVREVAARYLGALNYVAAVVIPERGNLAPGKTTIKRLENGLTLLVRSNPYARLTAIHLMAKNRAYLQPPAKAGLADFLLRLLPQGKSDSWSFAAQLDQLGARLKVVDDPFLSFDDYSKSPRYGEVRLEILDQHFSQGIKILAAMITLNKLDEEETEKVRKEMLTIISILSQDPAHVTEELYQKALFSGNPFSLPYLGTLETVKLITGEDLLDFEKEFLAPNNMIISIVTSLPAEEVLEEASSVFSGLKAVRGQKVMPGVPPRIKENRSLTHKLGRGQGYLLIAGLLPEFPPEDRLALSLGFSILSNRLAANLREKRGWAYATGASLHPGDGFASFTLSIGTSPNNLREAEQELLAELKTWQARGVTPEEVTLAATGLKSRLLTRLLTSINQAFYLSLFYLDRAEVFDYPSFAAQLEGLTAARINEALRRYISLEGLVTVAAE